MVKKQVIIQPELSLAISMQSNPGVYALLLGSGVSRSAAIPTGWDIIIKMIQKLALLEGEDLPTDPEKWYVDKYGHEPNYSDLLEGICKTASERSTLLKEYFEPTDEEKQQSIKMPTAAHKAIAKLVKKGVVKVIVTTNFDQLMEQALRAEGVTPTIINTPDGVKGAMPLVHSNCTLVKVHGDYLDLRTKNTTLELDEFDEEIDTLLDRIFDEFGLLVCGWSGQWDHALRKAITRSPNRRFSMYWASVGEPAEAAHGIILNRQAEIIQVQDADVFFKELVEKIEALNGSYSNHPLIPHIAVERTKKYVIAPQNEILLHDMLMGEVERVIEEIQPGKFTFPQTNEQAVKVIIDIEKIMEVVVSILINGCMWDKGNHTELWRKTILHLCYPSNSGRSSHPLQYYPAVIAFYCVGISMVVSKQYKALYDLLNIDVTENYSKRKLPEFLIRNIDSRGFNVLYPHDAQRKLPLSDRLCEILKPFYKAFFRLDDLFVREIDQFELMCSFAFAERNPHPFAGAFAYRHFEIKDNSVVKEIFEELDNNFENSPIVKAGFFNGQKNKWNEVRQKVDQMVEKVGF